MANVGRVSTASRRESPNVYNASSACECASTRVIASPQPSSARAQMLVSLSADNTSINEGRPNLCRPRVCMPEWLRCVYGGRTLIDAVPARFTNCKRSLHKVGVLFRSARVMTRRVRLAWTACGCPSTQFAACHPRAAMRRWARTHFTPLPVSIHQHWFVLPTRRMIIETCWRVSPPRGRASTKVGAAQRC